MRAYQIRQTPGKYVFMFSYWDANELFDLIPKDNNAKTRYISASTEPFSEEMEIDESKMVNWLDLFNIAYDYERKGEKNFFARRHVSEHASKNELKELIDKINPKIIVPIHTEHPKLFEDMFPGRVILPKYAQPIEV